MFTYSIKPEQNIPEHQQICIETDQWLNKFEIGTPIEVRVSPKEDYITPSDHSTSAFARVQHDTARTHTHGSDIFAREEEATQILDYCTKNSFKDLCLPSFSGTNSIITDVDCTITNIFALPFIAGPASSTSAIYTSLVVANSISAGACAGKTVISLDLDLYEKVYMLINTREDLRKEYIICLGELHIVFAHLRAIGAFINSSGIDDAWISAKCLTVNAW